MSAQEKEEDTYSISLTQTAEIEEEIVEVDEKKVKVEKYTIQDGDYLWKILRKKGLLKTRKLPELIKILKKLNSSLKNLDMVHPGKTIVVPLVVSPAKGDPVSPVKVPETATPIEALKDIDLEKYTVQKGDSLVRVIQSRFNIPAKDLYNEYLDLVKRMNPSVKNINNIYPGQKIRLPIYSPKVVRMPIKQETGRAKISEKPEPTPEEKPTPEKSKEILYKHLGEIIKLMGEEWVGKGQHFIPLKSGGQINLKADSYPLINTSTGKRIIIDINNDLPEKMAELISSNWQNYRVVHILGTDSLKEALDKILSKCDYSKVYNMGESLTIGGDIPIEISADWLVSTGNTGDKATRVFAVNLIGNPDKQTPLSIKNLLEGLGVKIIDYPPIDYSSRDNQPEENHLKVINDLPGLTDTLLSRTGHNVNKDEEISVYQSRKSNFNLTIKADYLFNINGTDCIIDLTGIGPDISSLLKEHRFKVITINPDEKPVLIVEKILEFLDARFIKGPLTLQATSREKTRNIGLTIPGIVFIDELNRKILATSVNIPEELLDFLSRKKYRVIQLPTR